jgi:hypothetical protein
MRQQSACSPSACAPFGIAFAVGAVAVVAATPVAAVVFAPAPVWPRLLTVAVAVGWQAASFADVAAAAATAGLGYLLFSYLLFNGFLVNRFGELTWHGVASVWRCWRWRLVRVSQHAGCKRSWLEKRSASTRTGSRRLSM